MTASEFDSTEQSPGAYSGSGGAKATDFETLYRQGTQLLHKGKASEAVAPLETAYNLNPDNVDLGINLSGAYILAKRFGKAVEVLEPLSQINPDHAMIWVNLGAAYLGNPLLATNNDQLQAIKAFEQALRINPLAHSAAYNIGLIYRDRREFDKAKEWFGKAVQHNPHDLDARRILAKLEAERDAF